MHVIRLFLLYACLLSNICVDTVLAANHIAEPFNQRPLHSTGTTPTCLNPPRDSCEFYANCLESRYHCGPQGYPLGYGEKFCQKFAAGRAELSPQGRVWMLDVMQCLQRVLVPEASGSVSNATCSSIETKAFASHAPCYVKSGFCVLPLSDWLAVVHIVGIATLLETLEAFLESMKTAEGCLEMYLSLIDHRHI